MDELQLQRQWREEERAAQRRIQMQRDLIAKRSEGATGYGVALFALYGESVGMGVDHLLTRLLENPYQAGKHLGVWPLLLHFCDRGPRSIAAIALGVVIDGISRPIRQAELARRIGTAMQSELRAVRIYQKKGRALLAMVKRHYGRKAVQPYVMERLSVDPSGWTSLERKELGLLMLEVIVANTALITVTKTKPAMVEPTEEALEVIRLNPPRPLPVRRLPLLMPPEPWTDVVRGTKELVTSRRPMDLSHITKSSMGTALAVVNYVEQQELRIDPWMVGHQRVAWDSNLPLFSVTRDPVDERDAHMRGKERARIEDTLRQAEEVAEFPIWLEHDFDFRGRLYCTSRVGGHQGPDHQKALLQFAKREPVDADGFNQMLAAAAGHYGLSRSSWEERATWGRDHLQMMQAIAENPLDLLDQWKGASDPWQFLQAARAVGLYLAGERESGVPIRFDQTCSGPGIISMLCRDEALARHTNVIGDRRRDLYQHVADGLVQALQMDLDGFDFYSARMATLWLGYGVDRSLVKGPVMTTVYGAKHFGLVDQLVRWLEEKNPDVRLHEMENQYVRPARYLARKLSVLIGAELRSCVALEKWLRDVSRRCMRRNKRLQWLSPMSFPVALGVRVEERQRVNTVINGVRRWQRTDAEYDPGQLSARETNRGVTANFVHTFDAALCQAMVVRCAAIEAPLLTNHDCFATTPAHANWLHGALLSEMRAMYATDWLPEMRLEISQRAGVDLGHPPCVGTLRAGAIGENPYCFS